MEESPSEVAEHYDELAEHWETIATGPGRSHILVPAVRSLLPDLDGRRILDAGCGDGLYAAWLADRGGDVVGIDLSEEMVSVARDRYGDAAEFQQADLTEDIPAEDDAFDLVVCQHVFSHLPAVEGALSEFARVLRPGGELVLSTHHPFHDFLVTREKEESPAVKALDAELDPFVVTETERPRYHETERFQVYWGGNPEEVESAPGTYFRRPLSGLVQPLLAVGFELRELVEPTPDEEFRTEHPEVAEALAHRPPGALCLRAERT